MLIALCESHGPPKGRVRKYVKQPVRPVRFPNPAVLCRRKNCEDEALIWLDEQDWQAYQEDHQRVFEPIGPGVKIRME